MKEFIVRIRQSIYGPEYYHLLLGRKLRYSVKYFGTLALFLTTILTIASSIPLVLGANTFIHEFPAKFFAYYPDDLTITIDKGIVATNVPEPYFLPLPTQLKDNTPVDGSLEHLIVFDTGEPFTLMQFALDKSLIWVGRDTIAYRDKAGSVTIQKIAPSTSLIVNEQKLHDIASHFTPFYPFIGPIIVLVIFVALFIGFAVQLVYLLFAAVLIMILGLLMKLKFSYRLAYQIGLHAITLPILVDTALIIFGLDMVRVLFAPTIILLLVVYVNFTKREKIAVHGDAAS